MAVLGWDFRITTSGQTRLDFVDPQPELFLTDPDYVFSTNSFAANNSPAGVVGSVNVLNDDYLGGDFTADFSNVPVSGTRLLAQLRVTTNTDLPPVFGDSFTISLEDAPDFKDTFFEDADGTPITYVVEKTGTVSISAVPEPSTLVQIAGALSALAVGWRLRHRRLTSDSRRAW